MFTVLAVAYVAVSAPAPALTARFGRRVIAAGGACLTLALGGLALGVAGSARAGRCWCSCPACCWRAPASGSATRR